MGLTMKKILDRFDDCNKFSLTRRVLRNNITISQEEFEKALEKIEERTKEEKRKIYEDNKEKFANYPEFDKLYDEIKKECYEFYYDKNREYYLNKHYNDEKIAQLKKIGITDEKIDKMKKDFFRCSFIADNVGKTTKYGNEYRKFFWMFYHDVAMMIDRQNEKERYCLSNGKSPLGQIPNELKEHLLYYEVSFFNSVTVSGGLMINYYFKLNNETKKYLLQFRNDFSMEELEDLTLYKENEINFSSCTHEGFNSIEIDYKNMSNDEMVDFINDEYPEENNDKIVETVNKLIAIEEGTKFSFKEIGINDKILMNKICLVCDKINLHLISSQNNQNRWATLNNDGNLQNAREIPAILCNLDDIIEKTMKHHMY